MPLTKELKTSGEFLEDGQLQIQSYTVIYEDGIEISRTQATRGTVDVGDDVSHQPQVVQDIAAALHTADRKAARVAVRKAARVAARTLQRQAEEARAAREAQAAAAPTT